MEKCHGAIELGLSRCIAGHFELHLPQRLGLLAWRNFMVMRVRERTQHRKTCADHRRQELRADHAQSPGYPIVRRRPAERNLHIIAPSAAPGHLADAAARKRWREAEWGAGFL